MDKRDGFYEHSNPGSAGLSVMLFVFAIVGFLQAFLPVFSGVQKIVLFAMVAFLLWGSWITKCSAEIKVRIDQEQVRICKSGQAKNASPCGTTFQSCIRYMGQKV